MLVGVYGLILELLPALARAAIDTLNDWRLLHGTMLAAPAVIECDAQCSGPSGDNAIRFRIAQK